MSSTSGDGEEVSWVKWFCSLRGNGFLIEVDEEYIRDRFNLAGLNEQVPHFKRALEIITDMDTDDYDSKRNRTANNVADQAAELLYEMIHSRFLITPSGIKLMAAKFKAEHFGHCPRVFCAGQPCLPIGLSDVPGEDTVKLYCPKCRDLYTPKLSRQQQMDGAYFGTGFPHMLFLSHPELRPEFPAKKYIPKVYGFKIHPQAYKIPKKGTLAKKQDSVCSSFAGGEGKTTSVKGKTNSISSNVGVKNLRKH